MEPGSVADRYVIDLCDRFWRWRMRDLPSFASYVGFHEYSHLLDDKGEEAFARRKNEANQYLREANTIDHVACNKENAYHLYTLRHALQTYVTGMEFGGYYNVVDYWHGVDRDLHQALNNSPFKTIQDYYNCIKRLKSFTNQVDDAIKLLAAGLEKRLFNPKSSIELAIIRLTKIMELGHETSLLYKPFRNIPKDFTESERHELQQAGLDVLKSTNIALGKLRDYLQQNVLPHSRDNGNLSILSLPNGKARYAACVRYHCDEDIDPEVIHQIGLQEVERTKTKIQQLMTKAGVSGGINDFKEHLCKQETMFCASQEEMVAYYQHILDDKIRPKLKDYFDYKPDIELRILPDTNMPAAGIYYGPPADGKQPARFLICCDNLHDRPKYGATALALHEAEPGHHFQACFVIEKTKLPEFRIYKDDRKYGEGPSAFPMYCAYTEGWALYCEELGVEMGAYDDDSSLFGYYCSDIARACRLVVDTGIHALGWSREKALSYMKENSGLSEERSNKEIDRYATVPAQALSYKIGHLKFQELRKRAEIELGGLFDIKSFHRACIQCGQVPLQLLEQSIQDFINHTKREGTDI